jgi:hypothetical protein
MCEHKWDSCYLTVPFRQAHAHAHGLVLDLKRLKAALSTQYLKKSDLFLSFDEIALLN